MKLVRNILILLLLLGGQQERARAAATLLPNGEQCFQAVSGITGMVGLIGTITGGSGGTAGSYGGVAVTGGTGSGATANITVAGGTITAVTILNPGTAYVVGDTLSAASGDIGGVTGFSVPVSSVSINSSLAAGRVYFYYPNTNSFKSTWFNADASASHQNTNPVQLDANGCAIIYGTGSYRQVVQDSLGNTVWDALTTDTSATNNMFWAGLAAGTPNTITITDAGFNATDGSVIQFIALTANTGSATLNPSGFAAIPVLTPTVAGPVAVSANAWAAGDVVNVVYLASQNAFQLLNPLPATSSNQALAQPQGYLTLTNAASGGPIQGSSDVIGVSTVYYSPYVGNQVPIYNGTSFVTFSFSELTLTLTSNHLANTIYDVCVFSNNGSPTLVTGPAWSNSGAGTGDRGTGASSAQLARINGFWVNAVALTGANGTNTYSISNNQCTYVGSLLIDSAPGQVSNYRTWGQSRKWGTWNAYNRVPIYLKAGDSTASWTYATNTIRPSNNSTSNSLTLFSGLPEEIYDLKFTQRTFASANNNTSEGNIGIGFNATNAFSGLVGENLVGSGTVVTGKATTYSEYIVPPSLGINTVTALESALTTTITFYGTETNMVLSAFWRG